MFALAISLPVQSSSFWFRVVSWYVPSRKPGCLINTEPKEDPEEGEQVSLLTRRIHKAGPGKAELSQSPEKPAITGEVQQRFSSCFSPNYSRFRVEELHLASSLGTVLLCHTIWTILLLSLVICCSTISCSGVFPRASRFLYKKKTKTLPGNACLPYVVFDFPLSLFYLWLKVLVTQ